MIKLGVENLHLTYGFNAVVLQGVSLELRQGEVVSLLGPSGCGKTTALRAIAGLETPARGKVAINSNVVFDGESGVEVPAEKRNLGLVFQSYALWPHRNVNDNVAYGLKLRGIRTAEIKDRTATVLRDLGLGHLGERFPHQLSGGQQQRVAIARALVYNPPVILMDEPLSNLDAKLREEARVWLRELISRLQLSAIIVTHDQSEALAMSDRILLMDQGRIVQSGTPQAMYGDPQTLFAAEFMGSNNRIPGNVGEVRDGAAQIGGEGWSLWGRSRPGGDGGRHRHDPPERVRIADGRKLQSARTASPISAATGHVFLGVTLRAHTPGRWRAAHG
jgi:iron(III) transport system ATP-binding protein